MFNKLSDKLQGVFSSLKSKGALKEGDVKLALREIKLALLDADVALPVAKDFVAHVKEQAIGQDVIKGINPAQQVIKIVNDELIRKLGEQTEELNLKAAPPAVILMVGLQGAGKTTTSAKIANLLKRDKKVLLSSLDVYRPAAQKQLAVLGEQIGVDSLEIIEGQKPEEIAKRALKKAKTELYDVVLVDTAGRLSIDEEMMNEIKSIYKITNPVETLLVVDAMTGQDAVNTAKNFNEAVGITGTVLTRIDGDARGGAALSMRHITNVPIKIIGTGEKIENIEFFHPDRIASRILDMGDVVSLVEKTIENIDMVEAEKMSQRMQKGKFDLNDFSSQLNQMQNLGGMGGIMKMLPGAGKLQKALDNANMDNSIITKQQAIISSMTKRERENPDILKASRKIRVANGAGVQVSQVNSLLKQFKQMQTMMKKMKKFGPAGMMKQFAPLMGNMGMPSAEDMQGMDPSDLQKMLKGK